MTEITIALILVLTTLNVVVLRELWRLYLQLNHGGPDAQRFLRAMILLVLALMAELGVKIVAWGTGVAFIPGFPIYALRALAAMSNALILFGLWRLLVFVRGRQ